MNLSTIIAAAPGKPKRGRRKADAQAEADQIVREAAVGRLNAGDLASEQVADAFGVSTRTLRRWARELAQRN